MEGDVGEAWESMPSGVLCNKRQPKRDWKDIFTENCVTAEHNGCSPTVRLWLCKPCE